MYGELEKNGKAVLFTYFKQDLKRGDGCFSEELARCGTVSAMKIRTLTELRDSSRCLQATPHIRSQYGNGLWRARIDLLSPNASTNGTPKKHRYQQFHPKR